MSRLTGEKSQSGSPGAASPVRKLLPVVLAAAFIAYLVRTLWLRHAEIEHAFDLDWAELGAIVVLLMLSHLQRTFELNYMLRRLGVPERFADGLALTGAAMLLNYLPLSAGSVARAVVLRRRHDLRYTSYVGTLMVGAVVNATVAAACGLAAVLALSKRAVFTLPLVVPLAGLTVAGALALSLPVGWAPRGPGFVAKKLRTLSEGLALIRGRGEGLLVLFVSSLVKLGLNTLRLWLCFDALGIPVSPLAMTLIGSAAILMSVVNLVPSNIGLRELVLGGLSAAIGYSPAMGVAAASLERVVALGYAFVAGPPSILHVRRFMGLTAAAPPPDSSPVRSV